MTFRVRNKLCVFFVFYPVSDNAVIDSPHGYNFHFDQVSLKNQLPSGHMHNQGSVRTIDLDALENILMDLIFAANRWRLDAMPAQSVLGSNPRTHCGITVLFRTLTDRISFEKLRGLCWRTVLLWLCRANRFPRIISQFRHIHEASYNPLCLPNGCWAGRSCQDF